MPVARYTFPDVILFDVVIEFDVVNDGALQSPSLSRPSGVVDGEIKDETVCHSGMNRDKCRRARKC